ncbi:hypothetical protein F5Y17DRAFT_80469 [Xylariaceae sp. FL0594]|nr:hypothetical protein F5Y17DRAFT_80469 [Xylariaceae sp. FL0594]
MINVNRPSLDQARVGDAAVEARRKVPRLGYLPSRGFRKFRGQYLVKSRCFSFLIGEGGLRARLVASHVIASLVCITGFSSRHWRHSHCREDRRLKQIGRNWQLQLVEVGINLTTRGAGDPPVIIRLYEKIKGCGVIPGLNWLSLPCHNHPNWPLTHYVKVQILGKSFCLPCEGHMHISPTRFLHLRLPDHLQVATCSASV